jgi:cyclopropane fatty-acyl-phospholipid synthase-like methyltransferase
MPSVASIKHIIRSNPVIRWSIRLSEALIFGGSIRRAVLTAFLGAHHQSMFRRKWWWWSYGEPHFTDQSITFWRLYRGNMGQGVYSLARAFYAAEHVKHGNCVLDIGCGDGGITKRCLAPRAARVDAIDVEPSAISIALRTNAAPNIFYQVLDAISQELPKESYDVVVMDGVLGHLSKPDSETLFKKIAGLIGRDGVFVGSESLGQDGADHLQIFDRIENLQELLGMSFSSVETKVSEYTLSSAYKRTEAYWSCRNDR